MTPESQPCYCSLLQREEWQNTDAKFRTFWCMSISRTFKLGSQVDFFLLKLFAWKKYLYNICTWKKVGFSSAPTVHAMMRENCLQITLPHLGTADQMQSTGRCTYVVFLCNVIFFSHSLPSKESDTECRLLFTQCVKHLSLYFRCSLYVVLLTAICSLEMTVSPEQKLLLLMVLLEWSELMSHSLPSSSEKGESDRGEPLSFGRKGWRTRRGMRLRGLPFSGDFLSC